MELTGFLVRSLIYILMLAVSVWALSAWDYEKILKKNHVRQAQVLYLLLAMALAYLSGSFLISFLYRV